MKNFIEEITGLIQKQLGSNYDIHTEKVTKNNDTELHGLIIREKGRQKKIVPTIYLEVFFEAYQQGVTLKETAEHIIDIYNAHSAKLDFDITQVLNYDAVKKQISFHLINTERNAKLLQDVPHLQYFDLSIIFRINIESDAIGDASIVLKNNIFELWGISVDELYQNALENTPRLMPCCIQNISKVIKELQGTSEINGINYSLFPIYVITNEYKSNGCGCILYPNVLENFADVIKGDLYLLPSSVHEMLIIPADFEDASRLRNMVQEVNREQVSVEEFLSDNIYRYYRATKEIKIVTE